MFNLRSLASVIVISILILSPLSINVQAQSQTNGIGLTIAKINQLDNGKILGAEVYNPDPTKLNSYSTRVKVTPDDDIRYRWGGFLIDIKNVDAPIKAKSGYIKVYLGNEAKTENFIANAGANLPIKDIKSKLKEGENTILLQVVSNDGKAITPTTEISLTFQFTSESTLPGIEIASPKSGSVLTSTIIQDFDIKTPNFTLENNPTAKASTTSGKMAIYWDEVKPEKLIATVYKNQFKSSDYDFSKIEDGTTRKLIFVLKDGKDNEYKPSITANLDIKANFRGSIDIGLPKISILQPDKSSTNINLGEDDKISVQVSNFALVDNTNDKISEDGKGVLQVSIDGKKVAENLNKTQFTLGELNIGAIDKGQKELTVELVSKNFEKLNPVVSDSLKFNYIPSLNNASLSATDNANSNQDTQNPAWKIVIIVLIVILIIGGIAVLITKA